MKHEKLTFRSGFRVGPGNAKSQCAAMAIPPGGSEGGPENCHRGADQWLFVVEGKGVATVNNRKIELEVGTMLLIEAGDVHEISQLG
jgi:mannose-6-phosphate isomerase-like protein (cupin superfamily)